MSMVEVKVKMIQLQEMSLTSFLIDVKKQVNKKNQAILTSWTKKIDPLSLINLYDRVESFGENKLFWSNSEQNFMFFGFGTTKKLIAHQDRFKKLEVAWSTLVDQAVVYNPY